jgi:hypothetical protein
MALILYLMRMAAPKIRWPAHLSPPWLRNRKNTAGRAVWIIWCLGWATLWLFASGINHACGWLFLASLAALLIPVGKE